MAVFDGEREQKLGLSESLMLRMNRCVYRSTSICLFVCVINHSPNGETVIGLFTDELFAETNSEEDQGDFSNADGTDGEVLLK